MILSSKTSIKFANSGKQHHINKIVDEYARVVKEFTNILWKMDKIPLLLPKEITSKVPSWLSARLLQCAGKQASGIVRSARVKQERRLYQIKKFKDSGQNKKARKLQKIYNNVKVSKPALENINLELDSRFVKLKLDETKTMFEGWAVLSSIGRGIKIQLPFKKTKHINKLLFNNGKVKSGIRLGKKYITLMFDINVIHKNKSKKTLGIDIGVNSCISTFDGEKSNQSNKNNHGHDLNSINDILARKKVGSKAFKHAQLHRKNYINWCINQINWDDIKTLRIEKIRNLRKGKNTSRKLKHFIYKPILDRLKLTASLHDVHVEEINPTYTSQRCSVCGWTRKSNRSGLQFACEKCSNTDNADANAAKNVWFNLPSIGKQERLLHKNKTGFYWCETSKESIVPCVKEASLS